MSYTFSKNRSKKGGYKVKYKGKMMAEMSEQDIATFRKTMESRKGPEHEAAAR